MIGKRVRLLREANGYSLRQLAGLAGLSHSFISDIEHGRCNPSVNSLHTLAKALDVKPEFFLQIEVARDDREETA